jgi:spore maturation protein CgeB
MNAELEAFAREVEPDLVFFFLFEDEVERETIARLTANGLVTFNWFADDHWRFDSFSRHYAPAFSLVSTTDPAAPAKYRAAGCDRVVLTQWAFNPYAYVPQEPDLRYDVTFVGQRYGGRPKVVRALRRAGVDVRCWGHGWETGRLPHDEMVSVFAASRINLNLSNAWGGPLLRRRPIVGQIKARMFEVPGSGGFLLTERSPHLERYFEPERELSVFATTDQLVDRVRYWLEHEDERTHTARCGQERVLRDHTYDRRFSEIFGAAGLSDA